VLVLGIQRVLIPSFSRAKEEGAQSFGRTFSDGSILVMAIVGLASAGLIICGNLVVELLFGAKFLAARGVLRITLLTVVVQYASLLLVSSAVAWRRERTAAVGAFVAFPVNLVVLLVFLKNGTFSSGAEAVAWASLIYEIVIVLVVYYRMRKVFPISRGAFLAFMFAMLLALAAMFESRFSMDLSQKSQILAVFIAGGSAVVITALVLGKSAVRIAKSWQK
jgi:O-antigen/teichoic acid export membrane protein